MTKILRQVTQCSGVREPMARLVIGLPGGDAAAGDGVGAVVVVKVLEVTE